MKETTGYLLASINSTSDPFRRDALCTEMRGVIEKLEADAQALADVRTLDASGFRWLNVPADQAPELLKGQCICRLTQRFAPDPFKGRQWGEFAGATPEGARAKAAEWVRKQAAPTTEGLK